MTQTCIIVGASHAAAQCVPSLRQEGWEGDILIIGDEPHLPYQRPPLSKAFLSGEKTEEDLPIRPAAFYEKNAAEFRQGFVTKINRDEHTLTLENGDTLAYDKLVLSTGSRVRKITLPGSELEGVHYLRNIADVKGIQRDLGEGKNAVIIGGGYIGLETAASLRKQGMQVVVLEMAERILQRVTPPALSDFYTRVHTAEGVDIQTGVSVERIEGDGHVQQVVCADGKTFAADLVVVGVGVLPNVELAEDAGLEVNNGIRVDTHCRTNDPDIYAAGDCTNHYNAMYDCDLRLESVPNASEQAKVAAAAICGNAKAYNALPWFWSDQYDLKLQIAGLSQGFDDVVIRGDKEESRSFAAFYYKNGKLIAADCVNRPQEFMLTKKLLTQGLSVASDVINDESHNVKALLELAE
jgi:3-phenylpropionate/trans-cinnamate dioxygenase ferredoxin reductase subunit